MTDEAHARNTDPATSHQAAASLSLDVLRGSQRAVLEALVTYGAQSDEDLAHVYAAMQDEFQWPWQSPSGLRTRRKELTDKGFIRDSGRRTKLRSGRQAIIWEYVPAQAVPVTQSEPMALFP